jgi:hypothetical protein
MVTRAERFVGQAALKLDARDQSYKQQRLPE